MLDVSAAVSLSHEDAVRIGHRIWQNECGGTVAGLTSWNAGENFASLGIGHFIWYPAGKRGPFEESFPEFVRYAAQRGAKLPKLLLANGGDVCPWPSRAEFLAAESGGKMETLRQFLVDTIDLQADFLVNRMQAALPKMLAAASPAERGKVAQQFNRLASSAPGCYALIDYVNFKGEGVLLSERYQGRGWGLLQVLEEMSGSGDATAAVNEFADAATRVLRVRVENAPRERNEARWLPGWLNRIDSYRY
ncbi:MAG TPA: hypothetical protein VNW28_10090 [Chthoniobacterales bacterium]|nr:hypothetical protein [Chthoniobacterales bacterium]